MLKLEPNMLEAAEPALEEKRRQLAQVLQSRVFQGSGILTTLLQYLGNQSVDEPDHQLKEYTIAVDVFKRGSEFDPRTNSIVRVEAKRLRNKLREYYETEGKSDRVLIDLPKGHYRVDFSYAPRKVASSPPDSQTEAVQLSASTSPEAAPSRIFDSTKAGLIATIIILSIVTVLLALSSIGSHKGIRVAPPADLEADYSVVWAPFLKGNSPTLLVLSNPPIFRFLNNSDSEITSKQAVQLPPEQAELLADVLKDKLVMRQGGTPKLVLSTSSYTGIGEAIGLYHLTNLLRSAGKELSLKQSRTISAEDLKNHNVILLGSAWVNDWVEKLPVKESFIYTVNGSIENKDPLQGEEREYKPKYNARTGKAEEDYALVTVKPGVTDEHRLMTLAGLLSEGTQAAAECVTRKEYLNAITQRLRELSENDEPPKYYQVLLKVSVDNGIPTTVSMLAIHPLKVTRN